MMVYPGNIPGLGFTVTKTPEFSTLVQDATNKYSTRLSQYSNPFWHWILVYNFLHDYAWGQFNYVSELKTLLGFFNSQQGQFGTFLFNDPSDNYVGPALSTATWVPGVMYGLNQGVLDAANHWQQVTTAGISGATIPTFNDTGGTTGDGSVVWTDRGVYASGFPNCPLAQLQVVTDGAGNYYSPIQRTLDGNSYEDITDLNGGITVYANGVLQIGYPESGFNYQILGPGLAVPGASFMGMYLKWTAEPAGPITVQFNFYFRTRFETDSQDFEEFLHNIWTIGGDDSRNGSGMLKLCTARPNPL
jgi:hypothetical protein